jgi:hypothetical protein
MYVNEHDTDINTWRNREEPWRARIPYLYLFNSVRRLLFSYRCYASPSQVRFSMTRTFRVAIMFRELQMNPDAWKHCDSDAKTHITSAYGAYHKQQLRDVLGRTAEIFRTPYSKRPPLVCSSMNDETYLLRRMDPGHLGEDLICYGPPWHADPLQDRSRTASGYQVGPDDTAAMFLRNGRT